MNTQTERESQRQGEYRVQRERNIEMGDGGDDLTT